MTSDLFNNDCLEQMKQIPDGSVDMVLCDLPYGVLNKNNPSAKWDSVIPVESLWEQWLRVCKDNAAIVLFAQGMFSATLMMSQPRLWRYNLIWNKNRSTGFLNANRMPLRSHEDILVFYRSQPTYNPQKYKAEKGKESHSRGVYKEFKNQCYGGFNFVEDGDLSIKFPKSIIDIPREPPTELVHPTQKPVKLCSWLIKSYTNEGDTVLDNCMGSGTTGISCVETNRCFIGIEKDEKYFGIASKRINEAKSKMNQGELFNETV